jgi:putative flippase GtrA
MSDEATRVDLGLHVRVRHGLRRPHNWFQLVRFACVGASGYVVNLAVFTVCVHALSLDYRLAALVAFLVAVTNNFVWNRHWTFDAGDGHAGHQSARFFAVSVAAFCFNLAALYVLVAVAELPEVPAQAIAIVLATPVSFAGNKLWSFAR